MSGVPDLLLGIFFLKGTDLIVNIRWYDQSNKTSHSETAAEIYILFVWNVKKRRRHF